MSVPSHLRRLSALLVLALACVGCMEPKIKGAGAPEPKQGLAIVSLPSPEPDYTEVVDDGPYEVTAEGVYLPNKQMTPGSAYPDVTSKQLCANLGTYSTGDGAEYVSNPYLRSVRDPGPETKIRIFATYDIVTNRPDYQFDRLIPKSLGGNNEDANLWPLPLGVKGASAKNSLERKLFDLVCHNELDLKVAQRAMATDWWAAYKKYGGLDVESGEGKEEHAVRNGGPCTEEGAVGYTDNKHVPLTCTKRGDGSLQWTKRK